ncbi:MAG: hypothetical protein JHC46_05665, partial [Solirubrobacteraceae bacterium]|nr:hypothetical protein [Solirubrobacteraceae bacterium]
MAIEDDKDDIGADIRAAMEGTLTNEPPPSAPELDAAAPADETAEQKANRGRDEAGRFAKGEAKPRETLTLKLVATPKLGAAPPATDAPKAAETSRIPPPKGWNGTANIN